jgi:uncharacterized protein (DUF58 family)
MATSTSPSTASNNPTSSKRTPRWRQAWQLRQQRWLDRRIPKAQRVKLGLQNIFIIPNQQGLGFLLVLLLMFLGAVNYQLSLGFALVFLLLSVFVLSIFYTFRNLAGLHVAAVASQSVFVGEKAEFTVILSRHCGKYGTQTYQNVQVHYPNTLPVATDLVDTHEQRITLYVPCEQRGYCQPGRLVIDTLFPFGLCRAWSLLALDAACVVYPRPIACDLQWLLSQQAHTGATNITRGTDEFQGLRPYRQGDSLKQVAWKHVARGQGMHTKDYATPSDDKVWLRWSLFEDLGVEARLSRLCWCVLQLETTGVDYGLDIPGTRLEPSNGQQQYAQALHALALFGLPSR